jgi:hypothetical protein
LVAASTDAAAPPGAIFTPVALGDERRYIVCPPSTTIACPTTKEAASEHSHKTDQSGSSS